MQSDSGQFTIRGLFAIVAGCAILAAILRFSTLSISALGGGFAIGMILSLSFVAYIALLDSMERRAQARLAEKLDSESLPATVTTPPPPSA